MAVSLKFQWLFLSKLFNPAFDRLWSGTLRDKPMNDVISVEEAFDALVENLAKVATLSGPNLDNHRRSNQHYDLWIPNAGHQAMRGNDGRMVEYSSLRDEQWRPFYEAAWELCRIGVLTPGRFAPKGQEMGAGLFSGDGYTLTKAGKEWLAGATERPLMHPSRFADVLKKFTLFGDGYRQRATEAVRTYQTGSYLAACVMSGAAAESILLAIAITKAAGNETKVLADYSAKGGRLRVRQGITCGLASGLAAQFDAAMHVLHWWRDDASHGTMTTISEIEAHVSLTQLLRLAQFASDHWSRLTT